MVVPDWALNVAGRSLVNPARRLAAWHRREVGAAVGEYRVTDLVDRVVQALESFCNALPGHAAGQVDGALQADDDTEKAVDDLAERSLVAVWPLCCGSGPGGVGEVVAPRFSVTSACTPSRLICMPAAARRWASGRVQIGHPAVMTGARGGDVAANLGMVWNVAVPPCRVSGFPPSAARGALRPEVPVTDLILLF